MKDFPNAYRKGKYALEKLRRPAIKSKTKHIQRFYDYETSSKNNWIIKCDYYVKDPSWEVVVHFVDKWGLQAYLVDDRQRIIYHYSSHFLKRYNERFLHEPEMSKTDLLKRYLSKNSSALIETHPPSEEYEHPVFGRANEGIVLGNVELQGLWSIMHIRTFIAADMRHEGQEFRFDVTSELYKKYWEEVFPKRK